jgi:hypothetical protein
VDAERAQDRHWLARAQGWHLFLFQLDVSGNPLAMPCLAALLWISGKLGAVSVFYFCATFSLPLPLFSYCASPYIFSFLNLASSIIPASQSLKCLQTVSKTLTSQQMHHSSFGLSVLPFYWEQHNKETAEEPRDWALALRCTGFETAWKGLGTNLLHSFCHKGFICCFKGLGSSI